MWEEFKKKRAEQFKQNKDFVQLTEDDKQELKVKLIKAIAGVFGEIKVDENGEGFGMTNKYSESDHHEILLLALTNYYHEVFMSLKNKKSKFNKNLTKLLLGLSDEDIKKLEEPETIETLDILYQMMRSSINLALNLETDRRLELIMNQLDKCVKKKQSEQSEQPEQPEQTEQKEGN
jgi:hypothetical protein